jgi:hypothetical protein
MFESTTFSFPRLLSSTLLQRNQPNQLPTAPQELDPLPDPCPLPESAAAAAAAGRRRTLKERDRLLYAPMSDAGGLLYDKDAVYIDIPDWKVRAGGWLCRCLDAGVFVCVGGVGGVCEDCELCEDRW